MKAIWILISIALTLFVSSCNARTLDSVTPTVPETNVSVTATTNAQASNSLLKTTMGDFVIVSAQLVDASHENKAPNGYKFLLIGLARPDSERLVAGEFSFESFQSAFGSGNEVYVLGSDSTSTPYKGMGGWLDQDEPVAADFVMGFLVPLAETYTLYWNNNSPILLSIE